MEISVLAGLGRSNEDACVYKVSDEIAIVGTLDFFTPIVDEPEVFGGIAAANALSDVYAMGAKPIFAMNIACQEKCAEAKVSILGGHTVEDLEPKYGLAVIGVVHPKKAWVLGESCHAKRVWRNNALMAGDSLVLTKPRTP
eukprot:Skav214553  [mRNA]  locus=scaffold410:864578:871439:+ [translate_table: standard]